MSKFIALQPISRIVINKAIIVYIVPADPHIGANPYVMPGILTQPANHITRQTVCHCKPFQPIRFFIKTI